MKVSKERRKQLVEFFRKHYWSMEWFCKVTDEQVRHATANNLLAIRKIQNNGLDIGTIKEHKIQVSIVFLEGIPRFFDPKTKIYWPAF